MFLNILSDEVLGIVWPSFATGGRDRDLILLFLCDSDILSTLRLPGRVFRPTPIVTQGFGAVDPAAATNANNGESIALLT